MRLRPRQYIITQNAEKQRLDRLMVAKKLAPSRSKAQDLIKEGYVRVDGEKVIKPGDLWAESARIELVGASPEYVARSARKLSHALEIFDVDVKGRTALDIGASTGGFTEVLLENGAESVIALDVGRNQLHARLRNDKRVISLEGYDARNLKAADLPAPPGLITADVSFISLTKLMATPMQLAAEGAWIIALIKPQFELSKKELNKKGVVKSPQARLAAIKSVQDWFAAQPGWHIIGSAPSPLKGHAGNEEHLICVGREE